MVEDTWTGALEDWRQYITIWDLEPTYLGLSKPMEGVSGVDIVVYLPLLLINCSLFVNDVLLVFLFE